MSSKVKRKSKNCFICRFNHWNRNAPKLDFGGDRKIAGGKQK